MSTVQANQQLNTDADRTFGQGTPRRAFEMWDSLAWAKRVTAPRILSAEKRPSDRSLCGRYLIRSNFKLSHRRRAKRSQKCNIGGGAAGGHEHSSDPGPVVASVEGPPLAVEISLIAPSNSFCLAVSLAGAALTRIDPRL
jgi:hypothetical protein